MIDASIGPRQAATVMPWFKRSRVCIFAMTLLSQGPSALGDEWKDCVLSPTPRRLSACTRLADRPNAEPKTVAKALIFRGQAYRNRGDNQRAIADYNRARQLDPGQSLLILGLTLTAKGEFDLAATALEDRTRQAPKDAIAHNALGNVRLRRNELDRAIDAYSAAAKADPSFAFAYRNRGYVLGVKRERDRAIEDFNKAIALNPTFEDAYNSRGVVLDAMGERKRAIADFDKAIELDPGFARPYNNRGNVHRQNGETDKALADYNTAIRLDPRFSPTYFNRGDLFARRKEVDKALADFREVVKLGADNDGDRRRKELAAERIDRMLRQQGQPGVARGRVALVIGNSAYKHTSKLANPKNDARSMAAAFRRLGFASVLEHYDLSREQTLRVLRDFGDVAERAEWAVVFFAGHGIEMQGVNYIIPVDAKLARDTDVEDEAISLSKLQAKADAANKLGLVILDACRNNPFAARMIRSMGATRSVGRGFAPVEPEGNVLVVYAAKHGTTALDGDGSNSPFTASLLGNIEEPQLEINFLFRRVRDAVRKVTNRQQEPFIYGSLTSEPLYFRTATP
jgi:tetratricopeptide (TPR) repeat protein